MRCFTSAAKIAPTVWTFNLITCPEFTQPLMPQSRLDFSPNGCTVARQWRVTGINSDGVRGEKWVKTSNGSSSWQYRVGFCCWVDEKKSSVNTGTELRFQRGNQSINTLILSFYLTCVTRQLGAKPVRARAQSGTDGRQATLHKDQIYGGRRGVSCLSVGAVWELTTPDHSKCHSGDMYWTRISKMCSSV